MSQAPVAIIGAGLAGCECALRLARAGIEVTLFEQKPTHFSPAHTSPLLGELVCSNSFRNDGSNPPSGIALLKKELRTLHSDLMEIADQVKVPAGKALAVDRNKFSAGVTQKIESSPKITLIRKEITSLDDSSLSGFQRIVIAAGPLASENLSASLAKTMGSGYLYFYDAIAPIVTADSIDMNVAFRGSRYEESGEGDYLNCPMNAEEYHIFYEALLHGERVKGRDFEQEKHFEGCMPIEALADRGEQTLAFGPLKPVGFIDPRSRKRPFALLQLRPENQNRTMYNLVGCQTKLTYTAQAEIFRLVPGLTQAEFVRFGSMHRNTYVNAPKILNSELALNTKPFIHLAGQITGVEGYVESLACGLWVGILLNAKLLGLDLDPLPSTTALGSLLQHLASPCKNFQPSNAHFGLMPEPEISLKKKNRKVWYADRANKDFADWFAKMPPSLL